ncbi:MAG: HAMP domain-containing protein, partial [Calditrichales bacterium]
ISDQTIGFDQNLAPFPLLPTEASKLAFRTNGMDYRRQNLFLTQGTSWGIVKKSAGQLAGLTHAYHRLNEMSLYTILWHHTSLENGLHLTYPAGNVLPKEFDPMKRNWYLLAKSTPGIVWSEPYTDASTGDPILTISTAVYSPDGRFAGVTGIDMYLPSIFDWLQLNPAWSEGAEGMLIARIREGDSLRIQIFARMNYQEDSRHWDKPLELESLKSEDTALFAGFLADVAAGKSGIRIMRYKGRKSIWTYQTSLDYQINTLMIVPYDNYMHLVDQTEKIIWRNSQDFLIYSVMIGLLVIVVVVIVSVKRAKSFTDPINNLALAGKSLSEGDYDAQARVNTGDELQQLAEVFNQIGPKLREHEKMQNALELARIVQQRLLPKEAPKIEGFDIAGLCKYSDETGGDYYDFIQFDEIDPDKVSVILGDVTGHGIGAALLMASARSMLRNAIRHNAYDLSKIMYTFNNELTADTDPDKFITLFYALLDRKGKTISWATGGHDPAILLKKSGGETIMLKSEGVPMGFVPNMNFEQAGPLEMQSGDIVVIGTDGIWEAENEAEEMFGKERMMKVISENSHHSAHQICEKVVEEVIAHCGQLPQEDDITIIIIKTT